MTTKKLIHLVIFSSLITLLIYYFRMALELQRFTVRMDRTTNSYLTFYCETIYLELGSKNMIRGRLVYAESSLCTVPPRLKPDYEVLLMNPNNPKCSLIDVIISAKRNGYSAVILYGDESWTSYAEDPVFYERLNNKNVKMYVGVANKYDTPSFEHYFSYPNDAKYQVVIEDIGMEKSYEFRETHPILWNWIWTILFMLVVSSYFFIPHIRDKYIASKNRNVECIICKDVFAYKKTEKLPCNHIFHRKCIREWFLRKHTCPICRKPVSNEDRQFAYLPDHPPPDEFELADIQARHLLSQLLRQGSIRLDVLEREVNEGEDLYA